ncbi:MAG: glycosyltransferase family 2 protein [Candidatus Shapirobacteria bacterium]
MKLIDLSIIIISFNTKKILGQCLKSILSSRDKLRKEIIIVDNASADDSLRIVRKFQFSNSNFQIKLIKNKKNLGFAKANNQGIKIARGKNVLLLNSDTLVKKNSLSKLVKFAKKNKDLGAVAPRLLNADGSVQPSCFRFPSVKGAIKEFWLSKKNSFSKYYPKTGQPALVEAAVGAALLLPQKTIAKIGLLDERYFMYFEDLDYCRRIKKAGLKIYYLPQAEIVHIHGASGKKEKGKTNLWLKESSKIYYGLARYYLINFIIWSGQKWVKMKQ